MSLNLDEAPNVLVIGAGGVGVITAYSLYFCGKSQVSLVCRSDYDHIIQSGYKIESCDYGEVKNWKPHGVFRTVDEAAACGKFFDFIIITTKNIPDGPPDSTVHAILKPVVESNLKIDDAKVTSVVLIQNGIDIEKEVLAHFDKNVYNLSLLSGVQFIASTKMGPGHIVQKGQDHVSFGAFDKTDTISVDQARRLISIYHNEGHNRGLFDENVRETRWNKLLYNAAINTTTALVGLDVPRCFEFSVEKSATEFELFRPAMEDVARIAKSEGTEIDEQLLDYFNDITRNILYKPSMCVDLENKRLMELEIILGNPIRIAKENNVEVPTLRMLYNLLFMIQNKLKEEKKLIEFDEKTMKLVA